MRQLISEIEIHKKLALIGEELNHLYKDKDVTLIIIMKGAICLVADLIRNIEFKFNLECIHCSSYGEMGTTPNKTVDIYGLETLNLQGQDILIVDDIYDTGNTLATVTIELQKQNPKSIASLVLLNKKIEKITSIKPTYTLFEIEDHFVVGYGLDYKECYRGLPGIYVFNPEESV